MDDPRKGWGKLDGPSTVSGKLDRPEPARKSEYEMEHLSRILAFITMLLTIITIFAILWKAIF